MQDQSAGAKKPLGCWSWLLNAAEDNYETMHREFLAVVWATHLLRYFWNGKDLQCVQTMMALSGSLTSSSRDRDSPGEDSIDSNSIFCSSKSAHKIRSRTCICAPYNIENGHSRSWRWYFRAVDVFSPANRPLHRLKARQLVGQVLCMWKLQRNLQEATQHFNKSMHNRAGECYPYSNWRTLTLKELLREQAADVECQGSAQTVKHHTSCLSNDSNDILETKAPIDGTLQNLSSSHYALTSYACLTISTLAGHPGWKVRTAQCQNPSIGRKG